MRFTLDIKSTCLQALSAITEAKGKGLIILEQRKPVGSLTDGDIRRFILNGGSIEDNISNAMNKNFITLKNEPTYIESIALLDKGIKLVPIISDNNDVLDIVDVKSISRIPIHDPRLKGNELKYILDCIETNWISSQGSYVEKFEKLFSSYHESLYTTTTTSGTTALELAFKAIKEKREGYVLVPDLTFGATLNAVSNAGLTPIICPVNSKDFSIDLSSVPSSILSKTAAVCIVHLYGSVVNMKEILDLKEKYNFYIVEDCAEALGSKLNGFRAGTFGDISAFSFFGNKLITTGEGGMLITRNKDFYDYINVIKNHGMRSNRRYWHEVIGTNARMTNIQAAIGLAQLENLSSIVKKKRDIHRIYFEKLSKLNSKISIWHESLDLKSSYWLNTIEVKNKDHIDLLILEGEKRNIDFRRCFYPMHILPAFSEFSNKSFDYSESVSVYNHLICLPSGLNLVPDQILTVCDVVENATK